MNALTPEWKRNQYYQKLSSQCQCGGGGAGDGTAARWQLVEMKVVVLLRLRYFDKVDADWKLHAIGCNFGSSLIQVVGAAFDLSELDIKLRPKIEMSA